MNVLGLITARGGSKNIPKKNLALLAGRPLLAHTCEAAMSSKGLTRVMLSTDDAYIAAVGREYGVDVPFTRPAELATDETPSLDVALHALKWCEEEADWRVDVLMLLQPTSPLREGRHIDEALQLLESTGADTVVGTVEVPHRFSPYATMRMEAGRLKDFWDAPLTFDRFRRQELPVLYARNGPAVLAVRVPALLETRSFYGPLVVPYLMSEEDSVDIDSAFDLLVAEAVLARRREAGL